MKNAKRIFSFLLLSVYMLTSLGMGALAAEETPELISAPAIAAGEYEGEHEEAVDMLLKLGIISDGLMINENVTRGSFTGAAMQLMGIAPFTPSDTKFTDVTSENPNSGAINAAADMGIISGVGGGLFDPEGTISVAQAAKILVSIMGYDIHAQNRGGFPTGYLVVAAQTGLLDEVGDNGDRLCTWETASQLIYNALYIDILHKKVASEEYYTNKGETVMTEYMGILKFEGIVTADEFTSILSDLTEKEGMVRIGSELFYENGSGISTAMGIDVEAYYKENGKKKELVTYKESGNSRITEVDAYDLKDSTTKANIVYYPDGGDKTKTITTNSDTAVIYNGKYIPYQSLTDEMLDIEIGKIKAVSTSGSVAEVLFIENTEIFVVGSISYGSGTIADDFDDSKRLTIDPNGSAKIEIIHDGDRIELKDIKRKFVLSVTSSLDGELIKITACNDKLKGTVKEIGEDYLIIDEYKYEYIKSNKAEFDKLNVGDKVTFYFTADEKLAGYGSISADDEKYGYLLDAGASNTGLSAGMDGKFRIYTTDGKWNTYTNADKIKLNGSSTDDNGKKYTASTVINAIKAASFIAMNEGDSSARYLFQLIKFTLNSDGEITEIYTAEDNRYPQNDGTANGTGMYTENFSLDYRTRNKAAVDARESFYKDFGVFAGRYALGGTMGIQMPSRSLLISFAEGQTSRDVIEKSFSIFSPTSTWVNDQDNQGLFVELYDTNEDFTPQLLLNYADAKNDKAVSGGGTVTVQATDFEHFTVDKFVDGLDDSEMPARKLYGYYQNKYQSFVIDETAPAFIENPKLLNLRKGDVIRIKLSPTKAITNILKVFTLHPELDTGYDNSVWAQVRGSEYATDKDGHWLPNDPHSWSAFDTRVNEYLLNGNYYNEYRGDSGSAPSLIPAWRFDNKVGWNVISRMIHAKAHRVANGQLVIDLGTSHPDGYLRVGSYGTTANPDLDPPIYIEGGVKLPYSILTLSSSKPQITVYDEEKDEVRAGSVDDIDPYNPNQSLVIRNRYLVPYEIHIVNRKSAPENEIYWVGNYLY